MDKRSIEAILAAEREYFASGATLDVKFRLDMMTKLYNYIKEHEADIAEALCADLGKGAYESYMCETGMVLSEISYMIKHTPRYAKPRRARTPLAQFPSSSYEIASPYGCVLIMSPWNYPFLLSLDPLIDAVAAGNCVILKPSAYSPHTSELIMRMVSEVFEPGHVSVVTGGRAENAALLECKFDMIFFTGSQAVGREVLRHAAENLTPAVLELGGKSPCIVDESAKIDLAARRIVFGKLLNCGQTCVAPDYVLCHESVKDKLIAALCREIERQCTKHPLDVPDYGRIVSEKHFYRLLGLIDPQKVVIGGGADASRLKIAPTVMRDVTREDSVMREEIFGPILPVLTYSTEEELLSSLSALEKPLALYIFSEDKRRAKRIMSRLSFGGGCINDVIIHLATSDMGFGGVGESGMGSYHGRCGFEAFSHIKSIVSKSTRIDLPMRYRPYRKGRNERLLRKFLK